MLMNVELCGLGFKTAFLPYSDRWRLHRRFFHLTFRMEAILGFLPLQHRKGCQLLRQLLDTPEQLEDHVFEYVPLDMDSFLMIAKTRVLCLGGITLSTLLRDRCAFCAP
ncbi:hypothetical protein L210DRAFT_2532845 [Boletus edulis BED1]|uniref:Cytochrome P450 n=1 Tax=Boletus edulis BED1 TaxID=1328754 RepID=A0AAD4BC21_BOLED|nr:hypothetical protein L210DRAFT_2532845 [Boletus edulis BED1]